MTENSTVTQILDVAQRLTQTRGYHAFSYADISEEVGIRKASIHYHFPGKTDLGRELVARYREEVRRHVRRIDLTAQGAEEKLRWYAQIFRAVLRDGGRLCLCGALATDLPSLPEAVRAEVRGFFAENETWLADVLERGRLVGDVRFTGPAEVQAQGLLAGLEGAMLLARVHGDAQRYCAIAHQMLAGLGLNVSELEISEPDLALALAGQRDMPEAVR